MKNKIKGVIVGLITGLIISATTVGAITGAIQKELHYNNIKITMNGKEIIPKDANGNYVEPFIIDGTTYLPVRGIASSLGLDVQWDGNTNTVMLATYKENESGDEIIKETTNQDTSKETESKVEMTISQKNALKSAKSYLSFTAFSYEGLVNQLEYEKYPHDDAIFAANNCGADWNEQALKSAKSYLAFSAFSYKGLIKQLEFEKYTTEQATYAADNCGANWNEQAVKSAKSYLAFSAFSKDGLIRQLEFEGFTREQAEYAAKANGY